jgi:hypothetical protein
MIKFSYSFSDGYVSYNVLCVYCLELVQLLLMTGILWREDRSVFHVHGPFLQVAHNSCRSEAIYLLTLINMFIGMYDTTFVASSYYLLNGFVLYIYSLCESV